MENIFRTKTSVISFSLDLETLLYLDDYAREKGNLTRSQVIRYHIKLARQYLKIMEKQLSDANTVPNLDQEDTSFA